jgi:hypothetical protein
MGACMHFDLHPNHPAHAQAGNQAGADFSQAGNQASADFRNNSVVSGSAGGALRALQESVGAGSAASAGAASLRSLEESEGFFATIFGSISHFFFILFLAFKLYCYFAIWITISFGVIASMDIMECFMHTLRLHWVEFQSKFFKGGGTPFKPFRHENQVMGAEKK